MKPSRLCRWLVSGPSPGPSEVPLTAQMLVQLTALLWLSSDILAVVQKLSGCPFTMGMTLPRLGKVVVTRQL